ncbi:hypothetical protein LA5094_00855 [Roseibium album]|nr:hypothetical protein LA5094_00855 [Roseibium album]
MDPKSAGYSDFAFQPVSEAEGEDPGKFNLNGAVRDTVERANSQREIPGKAQQNERKAPARISTRKRRSGACATNKAWAGLFAEIAAGCGNSRCRNSGLKLS